jgi:hypothetical protein
MPSNEWLTLKSTMLWISIRHYTQKMKEANTPLNHPHSLLQVQPIHHQQIKPLFHQTFPAMVAEIVKEPLTLVKGVEGKLGNYLKK